MPKSRPFLFEPLFPDEHTHQKQSPTRNIYLYLLYGKWLWLDLPILSDNVIISCCFSRFIKSIPNRVQRFSNENEKNKKKLQQQKNVYFKWFQIIYYVYLFYNITQTVSVAFFYFFGWAEIDIKWRAVFMRSDWLCCRRSLKLRASSFEWFFARNQCAAYNNFPWLTVLIEYAWCETCCSLFISHLTNFVKLCTGTTRWAAPPARQPQRTKWPIESI